MKDDLSDLISGALAAHGLILRGGLNFSANDYPPAKAVLLVGNAGASYWPHFSRWCETQPRDLNNPLDTWSREVIGAVADTFGARAISPSDRPFAPFQQWAMRAEGLKPSPLGILMHPEYGLWHAYRGALLFDHEISIPEALKPIHLCDLCVGKPCLKACPVNAHSETVFAYQDCLAHVRGAGGQACRSDGCLDRNACPYGAAYRYPAHVQAFHMAAYAGL
ncbi:hypothetical protein ABFT80_10905 [Mesorhizobium sp. SB112]|uniref:hypothetical protein n=1 Tax=Mesorhizobium sp. SB112 TaxID=3151853 RepID=UPI00326747F6